MIKIRFTQNFRGRETKEEMFEAGDIEEFDDQTALTIVAMGKAIIIEEPVHQEIETPAPVKKPAPKKRVKK